MSTGDDASRRARRRACAFFAGADQPAGRPSYELLLLLILPLLLISLLLQTASGTLRLTLFGRRNSAETVRDAR